MQIFITPSGSVRCLYNESLPLNTLGRCDIRRASHVEPDAEGRWIADLAPVGGPELGRDAIDVSTMDSPNKFREFIPGMLDAGEVTMDINYDGTAAGTGNFLSQQLTQTAQAITVSFGEGTNTATSSSWVCSGFMTGLGHAIPHDDKVTQSVTIKLTGEPTYTDLS